MLDKIILIMARKNSKRIVDKNIREFAGIPLIKYSLEVAKQLDVQTVVCTDHEKIKALCESWYPKFIVIDQPVEIQEENGNCNKSMKYVLSAVPAKIVILLQPTTPIRNWTEIQNWITQFEKSNYDSGLSVVPETKFLYDYVGNCINPVDRSKSNPEKPVYYKENGSVFMFRTENLGDNHIVYGKKMLFVDLFDIDIDTEKEWRREEILITGGYYAN